MEQDLDLGTENILEQQVKKHLGVTSLPRVGTMDLWEGEAWFDFPRHHLHLGFYASVQCQVRRQNLGNLAAVRRPRVGVSLVVGPWHPTESLP